MNTIRTFFNYDRACKLFGLSYLFHTVTFQVINHFGREIRDLPTWDGMVTQLTNILLAYFCFKKDSPFRYFIFLPALGAPVAWVRFKIYSHPDFQHEGTFWQLIRFYEFFLMFAGIFFWLVVLINIRTYWPWICAMAKRLSEMVFSPVTLVSIFSIYTLSNRVVTWAPILWALNRKFETGIPPSGELGFSTLVVKFALSSLVFPLLCLTAEKKAFHVCLVSLIADLVGSIFVFRINLSACDPAIDHLCKFKMSMPSSEIMLTLAGTIFLYLYYLRNQETGRGITFERPLTETIRPS